MSDRERERRRQMEEQQQMQDRSVATSAAAQQAEKLLEEQRTPEFLDSMRDMGLTGWLTDELGPETSKIWPIANQSPKDYRRHRWLNENRAERIITEHTPGYLCRRHQELLELAQGINGRPDADVRINQTDQERRHVREAESAKTAMQSLGVNARGLKSVTEAIHTTRTEKPDDDRGSGGRVRGAFERVFK